MAWLLLPQLVALLLGGALLAQWAGPHRYRLDRLRGLALVVLIAGAAGTAAIYQELLSERSKAMRMTDLQRETRGGTEVRAPVGFVEWLRHRIRAHDRYHVVFGERRDEATYQWMAYRLYPARAVEASVDADWIVSVGVIASGPATARTLGGAEVFSRGFALTRVHG